MFFFKKKDWKDPRFLPKFSPGALTPSVPSTFVKLAPPRTVTVAAPISWGQVTHLDQQVLNQIMRLTASTLNPVVDENMKKDEYQAGDIVEVKDCDNVRGVLVAAKDGKPYLYIDDRHFIVETEQKNYGWRGDDQGSAPRIVRSAGVNLDPAKNYIWCESRNMKFVERPKKVTKKSSKAERDATRKKVYDKLEEVILPVELKNDITAQVVMHNEMYRIFEEWGLGEVIEYGRATTMLFWGGPGTGKTFCARKIAEALGIKMISFMAGELQSPMPGEYESNLAGKFREATQQGALLFLDECDGIIQSRQGMGQIMSGENNFLLQQIEKFEGILVMATNRITTLDEALERRLSLVVEFPAPTKENRQAIWARHLPKKMPLGEGVDPATLAEFELTGGQIKNVVLNAARLAVAADKPRVEVGDFASAIKRVVEGKKAFAGEDRENGRVGWLKRDKVRNQGNITKG